jgi:predicted O-methyltransferase YrrM
MRMMNRIKKIMRPIGKPVRQAYRENRARIISVFSPIGGVVASAETVIGYINKPATTELARASYALPSNPTIVEIGVFMGRSTVLLAKARKLRGDGKIYCIDPFDCSGDDYSIPHYERELKDTGVNSLEAVFLQNIKKQGLSDWVQVCKGTSAQIVSNWKSPVDLLLLDGDQSPEGAREAYESWLPFVKKGGFIILNNTRDRTPGHDGNTRIAAELLAAPRFSTQKWNDHTFAIKQFES